MNTKYLIKKLPSCLLGAILAAGIASTTMVSAVDGDPDPGLFELEGNTTDDGGDGTDWDPLYTESLKLLLDPPGTPIYPTNLITFTGIIDDLAPKTIFWKGGSKDINDVDEWWHKEGAVPDKDDITNAYAAAFTNPTKVCKKSSTDDTRVPCDDGDEDETNNPVTVHAVGDLIVYFGLDRFANSGDAFAGFWFYQNDVSLNGSQFIGTHKARDGDDPGDMLILVEYPQASNAHPEIKIYEWVESGGDVSTHLDLLATVSNAECDDDNGKVKVACAITNLDELTDAPAWPYTPKSGNELNIPFESFFEGGVNVTNLLGSTPCFSAFLAETRASRSETATLKDFALGNFDVCGATVTKSCESDINDDGDKVKVTFSGDAKNIGGLPLYVTLMDDKDSAVITAVCVNDTDGECGSGEDSPAADLVGEGTDTVAFSLIAGQAARYEGHYEVTTFDENTEFIDTVTMKVYQSDKVTLIEEVPAKSNDCPPTGIPSIDVTKACFANLIDPGDTIKRDISGKIENTGNVKLEAVSLTDTALTPTLFTYALDDGDGVPNESDTPLDALPTELEPHEIVWYSYTFTNSNADHKNTITATGTNVFDPSGPKATDMAVVTECKADLIRGLKITKDCDKGSSLAGVRLVAENDQLVIYVDNVINVKNVGDGTLTIGEALNVTITDTKVDLKQKLNGDPVFNCTGKTCKGKLKFGEEVTFSQSYKPTEADEGDPLSAIFSNTAEATGTGVISGSNADKVMAVANCPLCPIP